jgi:hypothetical protein
MYVEVILFKPSGKYYTTEQWEVPEQVPHEILPGLKRDVIGPYDMEHSKDFRRIVGGSVLIPTQEPWGYPHLFPGIAEHAAVVRSLDEARAARNK